MSMAFVTVVCGEVSMSDTPLREHTVNRTQEIVLKFQLVASSGEYCVEAASGCSGWIVLWLCGIFSKTYNCLAHWKGQEILWSFCKRMSDTLTSQL